jgi:hypothetical protein
VGAQEHLPRRPLLSTDGRMDLDAMKFMQDTLLELWQRSPRAASV